MFAAAALCIPDISAAQAPQSAATPAVEKEPPPAQLQGAAAAATTDWCSLPLCRDAEALRRAGDLEGALKLYRYIQDEVDVDEKVVRKPLLFFTQASLYLELGQPQPGLAALRRYREYIVGRADSDLPPGHRRQDVERLEQDLKGRMGRVRIAGGAPGVRILIDDKEVGVTPLRSPLSVLPGRHHIELAGTTSETQDIEVAAAQEVLIWPLQTTAAGAPQRGIEGSAGRPRWRIALGSVGLAAGTGMIIGGAVALHNDGHCVSPAPGGSCPIEVGANGQPVMRLVDGKATGAGLIAAGAVAAIGGAVLVAIPGRRAPLQAAVSVGSGGSLSLATAF